MKRKKNNLGFTLVELMITVLIIAILSSLAIPGILRARRNARIALVASNLKTFSVGFQMYANDNGALPADSHNVLPAGMGVYIQQEDWDADALGGHYNWEGPAWGEGGPYPYAGISVFGTTATVDELTQLDRSLDNGNLATGKFRQTPNGRYTYIFEE